MENRISTIWLFVLSVLGLLFSGYLSGMKFFSGTCAFNESCPYFWGYPACYYGFAMFLVLTIFSTLLILNKINHHKGAKTVMLVSLLGIVFAGYFTLKEIPILLNEGFTAYVFGLPTCALGLIFYIIIFITSQISLRKAPVLM